MVDRETLDERLARLEHELELIDPILARGRESYLGDESTRHVAERALQVAIQICIDVGAHLVTALALGPPSDYADVFERLAQGAELDRELAEALKLAAKQRNLLVHLYLDIDPNEVWKGLERAATLRDFARWARDTAARDPD